MSAARWLDGRLTDAAVADTSGAFPGSERADGVFETLRCEGGSVGWLDAHLARFARGARTLGLAWPPPWDPARALADTIAALAGASAALRIAWAPPHLSVAARPLVAPPEEASALLAEAGAAELPRPPGVKTTRRAAYDALRAEARRTGAFEALVRSSDGALVEGTVTNVFVVVDGALWTPPLGAGALPGIVRAVVLTELERAPLVDARGRAFRAGERDLRAADLVRAEEVLLTNSVLLVLGLDRVLGVGIGGVGIGAGAVRALPGGRGPVARALGARVAELEIASRTSGFLPGDRC